MQSGAFLSSYKPESIAELLRMRKDSPRPYRKGRNYRLGEFVSVLNLIFRIKPLYRCYLSCQEAFPTPTQKREWAAIVWCEASVRTGTYPGPLFEHEWFTIDSMDLLADMKANIRRAVEASYRFDAKAESISYNATRAKELLTKMAFIYSEPNSNGNSKQPYRHPIIQTVVNLLWFKNKGDDGMTFREHFSPFPVRAMALVLVVIECCVDEWAEGTRKESRWDENRFKTEYNSHLRALAEFHESDSGEGGVPLEVIRSDLLKNASDHAEMSDIREAPEGSEKEDVPAYDEMPIPRLRVEDEG
ncbi:hypothetical protein BC827DRAFT_396396 [Russula dissimulans]|nr:hypothetical protein BC827DRAFT_396396 [Russula dissimulans]